MDSRTLDGQPYPLRRAFVLLKVLPFVNSPYQEALLNTLRSSWLANTPQEALTGRQADRSLSCNIMSSSDLARIIPRTC
jgi:hypothetical protein